MAIPIIKNFLEHLNIKRVELDGFEADDIIGTLSCVLSEEEDTQVFMMTPDKDFAQLVKENVFLYKPAFMGRGVDILGVNEVLEKFKIKEFSNLDHPAKPRWSLDENAAFLKGAGVQL